jgi:hypothetical protein
MAMEASQPETVVDIIFCNYCTEFFESFGLFVYLGEWGVEGELIMTKWISKKSPGR